MFIQKIKLKKDMQQYYCKTEETKVWTDSIFEDIVTPQCHPLSLYVLLQYATQFQCYP